MANAYKIHPKDAMKIANEKGINLATISGSGENGRIVLIGNIEIKSDSISIVKYENILSAKMYFRAKF